MKTATVSEFRANMKEQLNEVEKDQDILILSGAKKKDFVLMTLQQFNSMEETAHLLSTPSNTARLMESIAQDRGGEITHTINFSEAKPKKIAGVHGSAVKKRSIKVKKRKAK